MIKKIFDKLNSLLKGFKLEHYKNKIKGYHIIKSEPLSLTLLLNGDLYIDYQILANGSYDFDTIKKLDEIISNFEKKNDKKNITFFDVGSNIGIMSLYLKKKYPDLIIYSFEPVSINYYQQKMNMIMNNLEYSLIRKTVGDTTRDDCNIYLPDKIIYTDFGKINMGIPSVYKNKYRTGSKYETVEMITLDDFIKEEMDSNSVFETNILIKIDVEGAELRVIRGMKNFLRGAKNVKMISECLFKENFDLYSKAVNILRSFSYKIYDYNNNDLSDVELNSLKNGNLVFEKVEE